jgi:hypothetical protein
VKDDHDQLDVLSASLGIQAGPGGGLTVEASLSLGGDSGTDIGWTHTG